MITDKFDKKDNITRNRKHLQQASPSAAASRQTTKQEVEDTKFKIRACNFPYRTINDVKKNIKRNELQVSVIEFTLAIGYYLSFGYVIVTNAKNALF